MAYNAKRFEYSGYCIKMCMVGRGGNLCRCNAVHFAGKRQPEEVSKLGYEGPHEEVNGVDEDHVDQELLSVIPEYQAWLEKRIRAGDIPESFRAYLRMRTAGTSHHSEER